MARRAWRVNGSGDENNGGCVYKISGVQITYLLKRKRIGSRRLFRVAACVAQSTQT
jgi:hypothetical protein